MYQNDDYGKDYLKGLKDGLGAKAASMIVAEESYETSEPTIDTHIVKLKSTNADVFLNIATPKFAAQAIKKMAEVAVEAGALPQQRLGLDRRRDHAGRPGQFAGHHLIRLSEGPVRSAMEKRCRHEGLERIPRQIFPGRPTAPTPR